jgi:nitrate/nitrite transporter NarK
MPIQTDGGVLYRWRGAFGILFGMFGFTLMRPWLHPWLMAKPVHFWYFEGAAFLAVLVLVTFKIWRKMRDREDMP